MKNLSGKFIVIDGPDGCGKSTQTHLLSEYLERRGLSTAIYRDPGATVIGEKIREILLATENDMMDIRTEVLLYMAARAQLWSEKIRKSMEAGKIIILDRWISSTCAYQGYAGGFGVDRVIKLAEACLERLWPDLTVILDIDQETASERLNTELDRMELKGRSYHEKVREGMLAMAGEYSNFMVIDSARDIESVHSDITEAVQNME